MVVVVAALIKKEGKFLIAKRSTGDKNMLGKWEFPRGKVDREENEKHAIEREIKEEFELDIKAREFLINNVCKYPFQIIDLRLYECEYIKGDFKLHAHSEYRFILKDEILSYDLCPADVPLAKFVKENL